MFDKYKAKVAIGLSSVYWSWRLVNLCRLSLNSNEKKLGFRGIVVQGKLRYSKIFFESPQPKILQHSTQ